jgi:nucleotide-binding universal stress UspA family protein
MKVLLATDGSQPAEVALDLAASIDWPAGSAIHLVTAVEPIEPVLTAAWAPGVATDVDQQQADLIASADVVLEHAARALVGTGAAITREALRGRAATAIIEAASDFGADVIVMGSRGHGTISSMVLGSVSAEVVDHAPCPVLVARRPRLTRVVLATDGSDCARVAERLVVSWPIFAKAAIEVTSVAHVGAPWTSGMALTAYEPTTDDYASSTNAIIADHQRFVDEAQKRLAEAGLRVTTRVVQGDAAAELIRVAQDEQADVIALGTHGRTGLARLLAGSIARKVMVHAPCSVLIARQRPTGNAG